MSDAADADGESPTTDPVPGIGLATAIDIPDEVVTHLNTIQDHTNVAQLQTALESKDGGRVKLKVFIHHGLHCPPLEVDHLIREHGFKLGARMTDPESDTKLYRTFVV